MPVVSIEISDALRKTIDNFILKNCSIEHGGFIFGTPTKFVSFLPVPNVAENKIIYINRNKTGNGILKHLQRLLDMK